MALAEQAAKDSAEKALLTWDVASSGCTGELMQVHHDAVVHMCVKMCLDLFHMTSLHTETAFKLPND